MSCTVCCEMALVAVPLAFCTQINRQDRGHGSTGNSGYQHRRTAPEDSTACESAISSSVIQHCKPMPA